MAILTKDELLQLFADNNAFEISASDIRDFIDSIYYYHDNDNTEWGNIEGDINNQTDLQNQFSTKADNVHTHISSDITDLQSVLDTKMDKDGSQHITGHLEVDGMTTTGVSSDGVKSEYRFTDNNSNVIPRIFWNSHEKKYYVTNENGVDVPLRYQGNDKTVTISWGQIAGNIIDQQDLYNYLSNLQYLIDVLDMEKADNNHTHEMVDVNNLVDTINDIYLQLSHQAPEHHRHQIQDIDNLEFTLDGKLDVQSDGDVDILGDLRIYRENSIEFVGDRLNAAIHGFKEFERKLTLNVYNDIGDIPNKIEINETDTLVKKNISMEDNEPTLDRHLTRKDYVDGLIINKEDKLGNPSNDDYTLYSKSDGTRYWSAPYEGDVKSVNNRIGDVVLNKNDVGLNNVDNTSDLNKPISNQTRLELDQKANENEVFKKSDHIIKDSSINDAGKPIVLNDNGVIDQSLFEYKYLNGKGTFTPSVVQEYPKGAQTADYWIVEGLTDQGYTFITGPLHGQTAYNGEAMIWTGITWKLQNLGIDLTHYYRLDGSVPITADFNAGDFKLTSVKDGVDDTDGATVGQFRIELNAGLDTKVNKSGDLISGPLVINSSLNVTGSANFNNIFSKNIKIGIPGDSKVGFYDDALTPKVIWDQVQQDFFVETDGISNYRVWHEGNTGSGGGLNADYLQGYTPQTLPVSDPTQTALNLKTDITDFESHTNNTSNPHSVTKDQVGLGNVENLAPDSMPISNATQSALNQKANISDIYEKWEFITESLGTPSANRPILLNSDGKVDSSMVDVSTFTYIGTWTPDCVDPADPSNCNEYPDTTGAVEGSFWVIAGVDPTNGYTFQLPPALGGDLYNETVNNGDYMVWNGSSWSIIPSAIDASLYYQLDGSVSITGPFASICRR